MPFGLTVAGSNLARVQTHNRRVVLDAIRRAGTQSRADLARRTHLTAQTVNNIVGDLEDLGLLTAGAPRRGARGQPSVPFDINPDGAFALGFHVDHRRIWGALVDFSGRVRSRHSLAARQPSPDAAANILARMTPGLIGKAGASAERVLGAGVAVPVRFGVGPITSAGPTTLPGWDADAAMHIGATLGLPVLIENDATAAAIGERLNGIGRDIDSYVYLLINDGLGAGVMIAGQPWRGAGGNAGEIGHMIVVPDGKLCPCGNRGCLERYVSLEALRDHLDGGVDAGSRGSLLRTALVGSERLDAWIAEAAPRLSQAVGIVEAAFDPETIILGGIVPRPLLERLVEALDLPVSVGARAVRERPRISLGQSGPEAALLGAAALPIFDEVSPRYDLLLKGG